MIDDNIRCPHCGRVISVTERTDYSGSSYQGTGTVINPKDRITLSKPNETIYIKDGTGSV